MLTAFPLFRLVLAGRSERVHGGARGAPPPTRRRGVGDVLFADFRRRRRRRRRDAKFGDVLGDVLDGSIDDARARVVTAPLDAPRAGVFVYSRSKRASRVSRERVGGSRDARERDRVAIRVPKKTRARELPDERREVVRDARPRLRRERVRGCGVPLRLSASACALGGARACRLPRRLDGRVRATDGLEARARALLARRVAARPGRAGRRERADVVVPSRGARRHRSHRVHASRRVRRVGVRRLPARRRHAV